MKNTVQSMPQPQINQTSSLHQHQHQRQIQMQTNSMNAIPTTQSLSLAVQSNQTSSIVKAPIAQQNKPKADVKPKKSRSKKPKTEPNKINNKTIAVNKMDDNAIKKDIDSGKSNVMISTSNILTEPNSTQKLITAEAMPQQQQIKSINVAKVCNPIQQLNNNHISTSLQSSISNSDPVVSQASVTQKVCLVFS